MRPYSVFQQICVLAIAISVFIGCGDLQERRYPDLDAARSDAAFERGWLPEPIPSTAADIREAHDLDTNEGWLVLGFAPEEYPRLHRMCADAGWRSLSRREIESLMVPEAPVDWWVSCAVLQTDGIDAYAREDHETDQCWWVLVQRENHTLISWHHFRTGRSGR